jgi:hypothetical protein
MAPLAERTIRTVLTHWRHRGVDADRADYFDAFADDDGRMLLAELRRLVDLLRVPASHALDNAYLSAAAGGPFRLDRILCAVVAARLSRGILAEWKHWCEVFPATPLRVRHVRGIAAYAGNAEPHPGAIEELADLVELAAPRVVGAGEVLRRAALVKECRGYVFDAVAAWRTRRSTPLLLSRLAAELDGLPNVVDKIARFASRLPLLADLTEALGGPKLGPLIRRRLGNVAAIWIADLFKKKLDSRSLAGGANTNPPVLGYAVAFRRTFDKAPLRRALEVVLADAISSGVELPVLVDCFVCVSHCLGGTVSGPTRAHLAAAVARSPNIADEGVAGYATLARWSESPVRRQWIVGRIAESVSEILRTRGDQVPPGSVLRSSLPVFLWDVVTSGTAERSSLRYRREHLRQALRFEGCPSGLIELVTQAV